MTIRKKIFLLAGILLAQFGAVVGVPLSRLVTEFDVYTDRYELVILRVLRQGPENSSEVQAAASNR
jgi:adenylate cyclase